MTVRIEILAADGIPEVAAGDDLAGLITTAFSDLRSGDIVTVTSKVVSKAEGRVVQSDRAPVVEAETAEVVARRGETVIARTSLGLVLAAAGVDASNTPAGTVALLPEAPDDSARRLRADLAAGNGVNVGVVITDTAGRAWRTGQVDVAIGCAGLTPLHSFAGHHDRFGNPLTVTAPAVADEIAGAAELVKTKLGGRPVAVVRGLGDLVLGVGDHGPGAAALVRARAEDLFGLGMREAVQAAVTDATGASPLTGGEPPARLVAMASGGLGELTMSLSGDSLTVSAEGAADPVRGAVTLGRFTERLAVLGRAHGWLVTTRFHRGPSAVVRFERYRP